jgi:SAM-dependent methyltransferase
MKLETERDVNEWVWAAKALAVVSAWSGLGLFERLRAGPVRRADLPADPRALATTIPVLVHLGLLAADEERVALTQTALRLLSERAMPTDRNLAMLGDLGRTLDVLREGGPVRDDQGRSKGTRGGTVDDPVSTERFLDWLYGVSEQPARSTFDWLAPGLPAGGSVLDLGGGHGRYARVFADAGYKATLFDQPQVVPLAQKRHGDALQYIEGDFHQVETFGGPYDLVLMCNVVHGESFEANASLVARAALALRAGGRVAIRDMFVDEHGQDPASAVFFGMTMLFYTEHGTSPNVRQVHDWFARAGLVDFRMIVSETHQILSARKG